MYYPDNAEIGAEVIGILCITILSTFFGLKYASIEGRTHYVRGLILALIAMSWVFDLIACMVSSANNGDYASCLTSFINCVVIYRIAKILLLLYFTEESYVLSMSKIPRRKSPIYIVSIVLALPQLVIIVLSGVYRVVEVKEEFPFMCYIGYDIPATITSVLYEIFISLFFVGIYYKHVLYPNQRQLASDMADSIHILAKRNLIAAVITMIASCANHAVMIALDGEERGLVATSIATIDITITACTVHWVTSHPVKVHCMGDVLKKFSEEEPIRLKIKQHQEVVVETEQMSMNVKG
ncbi:hypothetical protein BDF14DRAFT_1884154 [Spinellus fusiger]|nr:hypothetical protein BDF14DRAFT_1884154 [Spinellus fusiger]